MNVTEVKTDIETLRDITSAYITAGESLGDIFTIRELEHGWIRVRGEHADVSAVVMGAHAQGVAVR